MKPSQPIIYWNRRKQQEETELVYGEGFVNWLYGTMPGQRLSEWVLSGRGLSVAYGAYQASSLSAHKIAPFIRDYRIDMSEYEDPGFKSFNDFFIRRFRPGRREFVQDPSRMPAPCEARYLAFERIHPEQRFPVKGTALSAALILGSEARARPFMGGPLVIARLCPTDYHRYHYPDDGRTLEEFTLHGKLHSVNPMALRYKDEIFATNERHVSILETSRFGKLAYVEVGAMCVGRIVQTHPETRPFKRGDEKGYFLFGGSTVILIGEPGRWRPDVDLLEQSARQRETFIQLGDAIASA